MTKTRPTLRSLTDAALRTEFRLATEMAQSTDPFYLCHWKLVAAEMDRRGLKL